jgi:hypothetical protein
VGSHLEFPHHELEGRDNVERSFLRLNLNLTDDQSIPRAPSIIASTIVDLKVETPESVFCRTFRSSSSRKVSDLSAVAICYLALQGALHNGVATEH